MFIEYYNIINSGPASGTSIGMTLLFLVLALGISYFLLRKSTGLIKKLLPFIFFVSVVGVTFFDYNANREYRMLKGVLLNKKHSSIESVLQDHDEDENRLVVDGKEYFFIHPAADNTTIPNGSSIRLFYYGNKILGLWIKE